MACGEHKPMSESRRISNSDQTSLQRQSNSHFFPTIQRPGLSFGIPRRRSASELPLAIRSTRGAVFSRVSMI
ncbi:hypothetical protein BDV18DRAFT_140821 [Aspergillus unguis]